MAIFVPLPHDAVDALHGTATSALEAARREYLKFSTTSVDLEARQKTPTPLPGAEYLDAREKNRTDRLGALREAHGDLKARRRALADVAAALDVERIAADAPFLAPPAIDASPTASYMHVIACEAKRSAYERRLSRMDARDLADEVRRVDRDAGAEPHRSDALARLGVLAEHLHGRQGEEFAGAKSALIAARSRIAEDWTARRTLADKLTQTATALDEVQEIGASIQTGRTTQRLGFLQWEARRQKAA